MSPNHILRVFIGIALTKQFQSVYHNIMFRANTTKLLLITIMIIIAYSRVILHAFLSSADLFKINLFKKFFQKIYQGKKKKKISLFIIMIIHSLTSGLFCMFLLSADFRKNHRFQKILSGIFQQKQTNYG